MKKFLLLGGIIAVLVSGCSFRKTNMDVPTSTGEYKYNNEGLGFSMVLPSEFQYFQTQRKDKEDYVDIEIFVPTSDREYPQEVEGYGKPVVIRVMDNEAWEKTNQSPENTGFQKLGAKRSKTYGIKFWDNIPDDWLGKWNDDLKKKVIENFKY